MGISESSSVITLPASVDAGVSILSFLASTFPGIPRETWIQRILAGKVLDDDGRPIALDAPCVQSKRIYYFREVENEPVIPFPETILFQNDELLVACKPHFLPVTPGGRFVNECLLNRLRVRTGMADLTPLHRIDRETAGIVLFSVNRKTRGLYHALFMQGKIVKQYEAMAELHVPPAAKHWDIQNRLVRGEPRFRMRIQPGVANSRSLIRLVRQENHQGHFCLTPVSGKTHQLRVHMSSLGFPIVNDRLYPQLLPEQADDFARPLQLFARAIAFVDPVTGQEMAFRTASGLF